MKKKPPGSRHRHLSDEDTHLWEHTASSLEPLKRKRGRILDGAEPMEDIPPRLPPSPPEPKPATGAGKKTAAPQLPPPKPIPSAAPPALNQFDRKAARRLRQGSIDIEARIDLHGMRQAEAHLALRRFLMSCHGRGLRWVLVITGKGGPRRESNEESATFWAASNERGVLKRNVPMWLGEPELRAIVVSFTSAAIPHGGEGALYIQLRKPERR
jgi:DNA-nicking Smr family endonuclease